MYKGFKVIICIPAGRKAYMELLIPQLLVYKEANLIDEIHFWLNTEKQDDIKYMRDLASQISYVKLIELPQGVRVDGSKTVSCFYRYCIEEGTIYVKIDDDIAMLDKPAAFAAFLDFRIKRRDLFMVYANTINNSHCVHILQRMGKLNYKREIGLAGYRGFDPVSWANPAFTLDLHTQVLDTKHFDSLRYDHPWFLYEHERVSINVIAWVGSDFKKWCNGLEGYGNDDEHLISVDIPKALNIYNAIFGGFVVVHFAFYPQRAELEKHGFLEAFRKRVFESHLQWLQVPRYIIA